MDQGIAAILGVVVGGALSSSRAVFEWYAKRRRYETAIAIELRRAARTIDGKLAWLGRPIPSNIAEAIPDRIIPVEGRDLYLGEDERLSIPRPFWRTNYKEIVSVLSTRSYASFAEAFELVEMFEAKFNDMKLSFSGTVGDPRKMAEACYKDLLTINEQLKLTDGYARASRGAQAST